MVTFTTNRYMNILRKRIITMDNINDILAFFVILATVILEFGGNKVLAG